MVGVAPIARKILDSSDCDAAAPAGPKSVILVRRYLIGPVVRLPQQQPPVGCTLPTVVGPINVGSEPSFIVLLGRTEEEWDLLDQLTQDIGVGSGGFGCGMGSMEVESGTIP